MTDTTSPTRRQVLQISGTVAAAAAVTAACGAPSTGTAASPTAGGGSTAAGTTSSAAAGGGPTLATTDVPVGGGTIVQSARVVVTQPTAGTFKAFTAVCTHQGCIVSSVADDVINCACHGSQFSAVDGSVKAGPAPAPLAPVNVTVSGTTITLG